MKFLLIVLLVVPVVAQRNPSGGGGRSRSTNRVPEKAPTPDIVVNFHGELTAISSKKLTMTTGASKTEDVNQLDFSITKKTEFMDGDKKLKSGDFKVGEPIEVESKRLLDGTMEAVTVRRDH
jgi:hypothetical protein